MMSISNKRKQGWPQILLGAAVLLASPLGWAQKTTASLPRKKMRVMAEKSVAKPPRRRSAAEIGREFLKYQGNDRMPWQFYKPYADIFFKLKERARAVKAKNQEHQDHLLAYELFYEGLGQLIVDMAAEKRIMDEIKLENTTIPKEKRKEAFRDAAGKHDELREQFIRDFRNPPGKRSSAKTKKR